MSIRTFFDTKFLFPSYTFLLFLILMLSDKIRNFFPQGEWEIFGLIFGFIYVLNGVPIGFIVSQIWYVSFNQLIFRGNFGNSLKKPRKYVKFLHDKYDVDISNVINTITILDYLYNKHEDKLKGYVNRRWDMVNILGSTFVSILLALTLGFLLKTGIITNDVTNFNNLSNFNYSIIIIGIVFCGLIAYGIKRVSHEHEEMVLSILHNLNLSKSDIKKMFPTEYFIMADNDIACSN